jgi:glutaredoxin
MRAAGARGCRAENSLGSALPIWDKWSRVSALEELPPTAATGRARPRAPAGLESIVTTLRAILLAPLLLTFASLPGCHATLSPERIDQIQHWCGAHPFDPSKLTSKTIAFRPSAKPAGTPVVIYGTQWCAACEATTDYLTRRQIPYVEKDIEHDDGASAAMRATLDGAGFGEVDGVPVIDVRGTITVGFFPCVVEAAWAAR